LAQDDYFYEIQLTNKQLVFYFIAGAAGLVLAFLAGVMVGRGIDTGAGAAETTRAVADERVVTEQTPSPTPTEYSYAQRLENERPAEGLERPTVGATAQPGGSATPTSAVAAPKPSPTAPVRPVIPTPLPAAPAATPTQVPTPAPARAAATLPKTSGTGPSAKGFAVQVGSFKDRASADEVAKSLRSRQFPAFVVAPAGHKGGLFAVRVGVYRDRVDAKSVEERLRTEKFQPFIQPQ
jgi:cell division septation protein DedD